MTDHRVSISTIVAVAVIAAMLMPANSVYAQDSASTFGNRLPKVAVRVGGLYEFVFNEDNSQYRSGPGGEVNVLVHLWHRWSVMLTYTQSGVRFDDLPYLGPDREVLGSSTTYTCRQYLAGLRYDDPHIFGIRWLPAYLYISAGDITQTIEGKVVYSYIPTGDSYVTQFYPRESDYAVEFGFGVPLRISPSVNFDIGFARYLRFDKPKNGKNVSEYAWWQTVSLRAGLMFGLGTR